MLSGLGRFAVRRRRWILLASLGFVVLAGALGGGVAALLSGGGFEDPSSESVAGAETLERIFRSGHPDLVLLVTSRDASIESPDAQTAGARLTARLTREERVSQVVSAFVPGAPPSLTGADGRQALVLAHIKGNEDQAVERAGVFADRYTTSEGPISVAVGGQSRIFNQMSDQIEKDLMRAEMVTLPLLLLLLVVIFGSVVAAGLPLAVGVIAIVGTFLVLFLLTFITDVSIYALNLTTMLGLGLGIDYSLFIVARYREEVKRGLQSDDAVVRAVETAGKTVMFSALTVATSLAALLVFPLYFLRSFAYAGIPVVLIAAGGALLFLPALLATLAGRVDRWVLWRRRSPRGDQGAWARLAVFVMRRPIPILVVVTALLLLLGAPFLDARFATPDYRSLPGGTSSRTVQSQIVDNFSSEETAALSVVASHVEDVAAPAVASYARRLSTIPGVARVDSLAGSYMGGRRVAQPGPEAQRFAAPHATWLSVVPAVEPISPAGERLVKAVRAEPVPFAVDVTGPSAALVDEKAALASRIPVAAGTIIVAIFILLFLMTGSVVMPLKAMILNILSLSATFGAMVWVFQEGHLAHLLGFSPTGTIDTTSPILMFCVAFGLSMDYEVFLLSRIKEEHDRSGDNVSAVARGLARTGGIVTSAAILIAVVFLAFSTSEITFIKLIGVGLALAVIVDATIVRGLLVPAFMRLAGEANWWAPSPLRRLHRRWGSSESESFAVGGAAREGSRP